MHFIDLESRLARIREKVNSRIATVLDHGQYILGPEVTELEVALAKYVGVKHCVGVSSGTDSLLISLMALGVGTDDEVITVPYTWISTAEVISLAGAKTVFVDIDSRTWNLDPVLLEQAITERTKAIIPVGIYGQPPDMDPINEIAGRFGIPVIEDAAQSFGATYKGRKSCGLSTIGSTSFFPSKPLGGFGDAGAIFTDNDELAEKFRWIRVHGQARKHHHPVLGLNGRLDTIQAAAILAAFDVFPDEVGRRQKIANRYNASFEPLSEGKLTVPFILRDCTSVYAQYTILVNDRDELSSHLGNLGIPSVAYYSTPLYAQEVFTSLGFDKKNFPVTEEISKKCLSLPMSAYLAEEEQKKVTESICGYKRNLL